VAASLHDPSHREGSDLVRLQAWQVADTMTCGEGGGSSATNGLVAAVLALAMAAGVPDIQAIRGCTSRQPGACRVKMQVDRWVDRGRATRLGNNTKS